MNDGGLWLLLNVKLLSSALRFHSTLSPEERRGEVVGRLGGVLAGNEGENQSEPASLAAGQPRANGHHCRNRLLVSQEG